MVKTKLDPVPSKIIPRARGILGTMIDCPHCKETFFEEGRRDDTMMSCPACSEQMLVREI